MNQILDAIKENTLDGTNISTSLQNKKWMIDECTYKILESKITITDSYIVDNEHQVFLLSVEDDGNVSEFFATFGYDDNFAYTSLEDIGFVFAHFLYLIKEQKIPCNRNVTTESFLEEYLFTGDDVSIEQLHEFLPKCYGIFNSYLIKEQLPTQRQERQLFIIKILYEHVIQDGSQRVLHFGNDTLVAYNNVLNNACKHIPIEDVFLSLLEKKYKFCYLDLFRCIERLFIVSMTHEFANTLNSSINKEQIASFVKKYAGNGHQECQIHYLFTLLPVSITDVASSAFTGNVNVSKLFYETRNNIVHYQLSESSHENYSEDQWDSLIRFCLLAINFLYTEFDSYLNEIPEI